MIFGKNLWDTASKHNLHIEMGGVRKNDELTGPKDTAVWRHTDIMGF